MPVKSTASKSASAPKARKTRTRKTNTRTAKTVATPTAKKPAVKKVTVTSFKGGKVVSKVTTLKRPSTARLITPQRYWSDIQTRWAIHNFEIQELLKDFSKGYDSIRQLAK